MALAAVTSDGFSVTSSLAGATLDNAGGGSESNTWTVKVGTWSEAAGVCTANDAGDKTVVVASTAATAIQRVSHTAIAVAIGPVGRWVTGGISQGNYYLAYVNGSSNVQAFIRTDGGFTQIGSTGSTTVVSTDVVSIDCNSTTIRGLLNGSQETTGTEATLSTGIPGMYAGEPAPNTRDNFLYEVDAGAGRTTKNTRAFPLGLEVGMNWRS